LCYISLTCHGIGFLKDAPYALLCHLFGRKLVIHQHNKGMSADVDGWPYRWLMPIVYHHAKVILLSWRLYPDIERIVTRENVLICPNGINVIDNKNKKINDNDTPHLLFLSNLVESKGVFVLLDALKILADKGKDFHCDFVGGETKGIDASIFAEEVNRRQLNQRVSYLGQKYGDEKEQIMSRSDIFVFPSYEDCFPLVLLEAMSYKLPIVTTNEGAIPDEVTDGENGLISERKDSCSLAGCIERLIDNDTLRNIMGEIGYKKLITHFTSDQFELRMKCILEYLCEIDF
jgi:glycosyltransferase involved in cell wall biosynthesis